MKKEIITKLIQDISEFTLDGIVRADEVMHDNNNSPYIKIGALEQCIKSACIRLDNLVEMIEMGKVK